MDTRHRDTTPGASRPGATVLPFPLAAVIRPPDQAGLTLAPGDRVTGDPVFRCGRPFGRVVEVFLRHGRAVARLTVGHALTTAAPADLRRANPGDDASPWSAAP